MDDYDETTTSWHDDLRVEMVQAVLGNMVAAGEVAELEMPHIVVCRDQESGAVSYSGPFADGLAAMVFADRESAIDRELNDGEPLSFVVAALYPIERSEVC